MWRDLSTALCLMLVVEGLLPFLAPSRWRNMLRLIADLDDRRIRVAGLIAMLAGASLLYLVR